MHLKQMNHVKYCAFSRVPDASFHTVLRLSSDLINTCLAYQASTVVVRIIHKVTRENWPVFYPTFSTYGSKTLFIPYRKLREQGQ